MRRGAILLLALLPLAALAGDRWTAVRSTSFQAQVLTNGDDKNARNVLATLDQLQYLIGAGLGKDALKQDAVKFLWPVRVLAFKSQPPVSSRELKLARDAYLAAAPAAGALPPEFLRSYVHILLDSNSRRMPAAIETGLEDFYSTAQVDATKITLGAPPPVALRTPGWALIHLLVTNPTYAGRLRVVLYNLQQGADPNPAFRNAFGKSYADLEKEAAAYLAAGTFATVTVPGRPVNPARDYFVRPVEPATAAVALADLELAAGAADATAAYNALLNESPSAAMEGLGLLALAAGKTDDARQYFTTATQGGSMGAHAWFEYARLEPDKAKAAGALQKATELNPAWGEPYVVLATLETDDSRKLHWLKEAAQREPRNAERWRAVAEMYQRHNLYAEAAKAWSTAQGASVDDAERERMRQARLAIEGQRLAYQEAERKRKQEEEQRELQRLKDQALARVHAAEEKANKANPRPANSTAPVPWFGPDAPPGKAHGQLVQVDCVGKAMRVIIRDGDGKETRLALRDPANIGVLAGTGGALKCGPQSPVRAVSVEFYPKPDAKLGTAGELASITVQ